jgi:hypothetical protein
MLELVLFWQPKKCALDVLLIDTLENVPNHAY